MKLEFLKFEKKTRQRAYLFFSFEVDNEKFIFKIGYNPQTQLFTYNCKVFGEFISAYRHYTKKQGKVFNPKYDIQGLKAYLCFLKEYLKRVHFHNYYFTNHAKVKQNLQREISFFKALIEFLKDNENDLKKSFFEKNRQEKLSNFYEANKDLKINA